MKKLLIAVLLLVSPIALADYASDLEQWDSPYTETPKPSMRLQAFAAPVEGLLASPVPGITCAPDLSYPNPAWKWTVCSVAQGTKYVPSLAAWDYPAGFLYFASAAPNSLMLTAAFSGYSWSQQLNWPNGNTKSLTITGVTDHFPTLSSWPPYFTAMGGAWLGENPAAERTCGMIDYVQQSSDYGPLINKSLGIYLGGASEGGNTTIMRVMLMPDHCSSQVAMLRADVPPTLFMEKSAPQGWYWYQGATRLSWGNFDWNKADILQHKDKFRNIYMRMNGDTKDGSQVNFDLRFFHWVCDEGDIPCFGTWHDSGKHELTKVGINLPFMSDFSGADSSATLDKPLPVFTFSTANNYGLIGHYNLGLEWNSKTATKTADELRMGIRYVRRIDIGGGVVDQPMQATFKFKMIRAGFRPGLLLETKIGDQTGFTVVRPNGDVPLGSVTLGSNTAYTEVVLTDTHAPGC